MTLSAFTGPVIGFLDNPLSTGAANTDPDQWAPSLFISGNGILDPRPPFTYANGGGFGQKAYGFSGAQVFVLDQAPSALAANNIAASQVPVAATPVTLVSVTGAGITVPTSIIRADTGTLAANLLAIDVAQTPLTIGQSATIALWDPAKMIARNVRITSAGNDSTATFVVRGYDVYGYPMTETITGANIGIASGRKAFKYIASVTPAATLSGAAITIGTGDVFGLSLRADQFAYAEICYNNNWITANTGFLPADTAVATALTGDVRGTYAVQSASDGTKRLQIIMTISAANLNSILGQFGRTQF